MKTTKKLLAMALAAAMVVTAFAGCSGNNDTSSADSTSSASSEASTSSDASTSDESSATEDDGTIHPMRIVQPGTLCADYETGMAAVNEKLKEDGVNIEVSVTRIPWDAYAEKLNLMLTTGEEFELLHVMQDVKNLSAIAGMGAISSALWSSVEAGDEIVASDTLYGCTFALLNHGMSKFGVSVKFVDFADLAAVKAALTEKTKVVYLETPCNPTLKVVDIAEVAKIAHEYNKNIRVIVDNTFCSPYIQQPLSLGADVVVHSATKYINGHGDVIAGFVISDAEFIGKCRMFGLKDMTGAVMSPFNAFLIARGLKTLDIRMERHSANAMKVAEFLHDHPAIDKVYYPGLEDFEGHEIAKKQMKLYGGMMSIELKADRDAVANALNKLQLCTIAVSLGDAETLVEHAASMTHSTYTPEELKASGISEGLVRISVGLEDPDDIIADLKAVLDTLV